MIRDYLLLGLRFGRLVDGFVDAYVGDPALSKRVTDEPAPVPRELARDAASLRKALRDSGLSPGRSAYVDAQLAALEVSGRKLAGAEVGFVDEVEAYFQVRPELGDPSAYAGAHARLDGLLPGDGPLRDRYAAYRRRDEVAPDRLAACVLALSSALRDRVRASIGLPDAEVVEYDVVTDKPWSGFNYYHGAYRSQVAINADLPSRLSDLPHLVAHEAYPGHHTERCRKEDLLIGRGQAERSIFLVNTPECLVAEGLADLGLRVAVGPGWGVWAEAIYADLGIRFDGALAEAVATALKPLNPIRQDVALLLHDRGATEDEAVAYLARWGLVPEDRARKSIGFVTSPLWRAYISTYVEGERLLGAWLDSGGEFRRLLDESLTPAAIRAALPAGDPQPGAPPAVGDPQPPY